MTDPAAHPTSFYPVSLDVTGRACLVVGGGPVAARKARTLLECGAAVTVIAPSLGDEMEALAGRLDQVERRAYARGDAARFRLVATATGRPDVDGAVHDDAEAAGVWVNSADDRAHSSFILPAVHRDGPVTVAVSTSGLSPALSSWLRDRLAAECGEGAGAVAQLFAEARERLRLAGRRSDTVDWAALLDGPLLELVRTGDWDNARAILAAATIA
jgi:siroheme synthase-like protein